MKMAIEANNEPSIASLVGGIIHDAQDLLKQEIALARREISQEIDKTKQAVISLSVGIGIACLGGLLLILMVVQLIHEEGGLRLWLSYLIVGGILAILGGGLFFMGKAKAARIRMLPEQTMASMKENVQWIKNRV
jgi:hypothetical protein